ncbi:MAG: hypothetical protein V4724_28760 [Pseudomonadota bacterium]
MAKRIDWRVLAVCAWLLALPARASEQLTAWSYYNSPPYAVRDARDGLVPAVIAYLNTALAGRYAFTLKLLPRARLNLALAERRRGVVLFAPSAVFTGPAYSDYSWSVPLLHDRQELVSPAWNPVDFKSADALAGLRIGGMLGHNYPLLQKSIDAGALSVHRLNSETQPLDMLMVGRLDAATLATTSIDYWLHLHPAHAAHIHRSSDGLGEFTRHLLFTPGQQGARDACDQVLRHAVHDPAWKAIFARFGLTPAQPLSPGKG